MGLAQQLFGGLLRFTTAVCGPAPQSPRSPAPHAPHHPSAPPATPSCAPPPYLLPLHPRHQQATSSPRPNRRSKCLLSAIQSGARLRKAVTHDRSARRPRRKVSATLVLLLHQRCASSMSPPAPFVHSSTPDSAPEAPTMTHGSTSGHRERNR